MKEARLNRFAYGKLLLFVFVLSCGLLLECSTGSARPDGERLVCPAVNECLSPFESENERSSLDRQLQLALARICVSEAGFQTDTMDCRLIFETLRYRSDTGEITLGIMRAYSGLTFNRNRTDRRRWIPFLNDRFSEPTHWGELAGIPWSTRRGAWRNVYAYAGYLLSHPQVYPCTLQVHHWGARGFRRRMHLREGWIPVQCGETLNDFWSVPSRTRPETRVCRSASRICSNSR